MGRCSRREPTRQFRQAARSNCAFCFQQWPVSDSGLGKRSRFYIRICAPKEKCLLNFISEDLARVLKRKGLQCYRTPWTKMLARKESKEIFLVSSLDHYFHLSGFVLWGFVCVLVKTLKSHSALELNGKSRLSISSPVRHAGLEKMLAFMVRKE